MGMVIGWFWWKKAQEGFYVILEFPERKQSFSSNFFTQKFYIKLFFPM